MSKRILIRLNLLDYFRWLYNTMNNKVSFDDYLFLIDNNPETCLSYIFTVLNHGISNNLIFVRCENRLFEFAYLVADFQQYKHGLYNKEEFVDIKTRRMFSYNNL